MIGLFISRMFPPEGLAGLRQAEPRIRLAPGQMGRPAKAGENIIGSIRVFVNGVLEKLLG
jgi:hypothetical protein